MSAIKPATRPKLEPEAVRERLASMGVRDKVAVFAVPGYYRDTMGKPGENDRGIYDDALFLVTPEGVTAFNGNTDPSIHRPGIAKLKSGVWRYKPGIHGLSRPKAQQYPAFVQAGEVTVIRDGKGEDRGWFGINIHRGGINTTSSEGCQTIPPDQWDGFHSQLIAALKKHAQLTFPYALA